MKSNTDRFGYIVVLLVGGLVAISFLMGFLVPETQILSSESEPMNIEKTTHVEMLHDGALILNSTQLFRVQIGGATYVATELTPGYFNSRLSVHEGTHAKVFDVNAPISLATDASAEVTKTFEWRFVTAGTCLIALLVGIGIGLMLTNPISK